MKKITFIILTLLISFNAFASIYCPQTFTCTYGQGCTPSSPNPYNDSSNFQLPAETDYAEGIYTFTAAISNSIPDHFYMGVQCVYAPPASPISQYSPYLDYQATAKLTYDDSIYGNAWQRNSNYQRVCLNQAANCPFKVLLQK